MKSCDLNLNVVLLGELVFLMLDLEVCVCVCVWFREQLEILICRCGLEMVK